MMDTNTGKILIIAGIFLVVLGLVFTFWQRLPLLGKLPGDFYFQKGDFKFYFPLATSILLSLLLTLILNIISRLFNK